MYRMLSAWITFLVSSYSCTVILGKCSATEVSEKYFDMPASAYLEEPSVEILFVFHYIPSQNKYLVKIMLQTGKILSFICFP